MATGLAEADFVGEGAALVGVTTAGADVACAVAECAGADGALVVGLVDVIVADDVTFEVAELAACELFAVGVAVFDVVTALDVDDELGVTGIAVWAV